MGKPKQLEFLEKNSREGRTIQQVRPGSRPMRLPAVLIRRLLSPHTQRLPDEELSQRTKGDGAWPGIVSLPTSQTCKKYKKKAEKRKKKEHTKRANRKQIMR